MKPQRITIAQLNNQQQPHTACRMIAAGIVFAVAIFALYQCRPAYANPTDWHDDAVSRQIQTNARAEARKIWREERGDWQPNLTPAAEAELVRYTIQKQTDTVRATQEQ